jgi:N-acetylmuramoyl-L-alanine amidase
VRKVAIFVVGALGVAGLGWGLSRCSNASEASPGWPMAAARPSTVVFPEGFAVHRLYLDAGHGAEGNSGNQSCLCRDEQDFTLDLARDVAMRLTQTRHFDVRVSREPGALKPYAERVREAEAWGAAAFVSLHSDVRGETEPWEPEPGKHCLLSRAAPGFAVLWSDEGDLAVRRLSFARSLAQELERSGIHAYDGAEYQEHYAPDDRPGVFVDRHAADQRIFVLRRPSMPSILVETHNALDDREARRWDEPMTREAFASALANALVELLR